jgi:hypothetical protein
MVFVVVATGVATVLAAAVDFGWSLWLLPSWLLGRLLYWRLQSGYQVAAVVVGAVGSVVLYWLLR